jgi:hypothetical protein
MIAGYKSSIQRLAHLFRESRDTWKQRAAEKQKKLRAQEIRIRDLEKSRELWKHRAQIAEHEVRTYRQQNQTPASLSMHGDASVPPRP